MGVFVTFLSRYLPPFVAGNCMAAATIFDNLPMAVALLSAAALLVFFSLPVGGRMIRRMSESFGENEIAMTEIAEIAKAHQARLVAEIARMDDFIRMAEYLIKNGETDAEEEHDDSPIIIFTETAA